VRDARRRQRRERERDAEARERGFLEAQKRIEPCSYCGRLPGQVAMPDGARVVFHGPEAGPELEGTPTLIESGPHKGLPVISRPWSGGWGCRFCADGLPGEKFRAGTPHTIKLVDSPSRELVEQWRRDGRL
jgi:hypothetical protein